MMKNELLELVVLLINSGEIEYTDRTKNTYLFKNDKYRVCLNLIMESISIEYLNNTLAYLDKNNIDSGHGIFKIDDYYEIYDIMLSVVMDKEELDRLSKLMMTFANKDDFETASKIRDIISYINNVIKL